MSYELRLSQTEEVILATDKASVANRAYLEAKQRGLGVRLYALPVRRVG